MGRKPMGEAPDTDATTPQGRFADFLSRILRVSKDDVDKEEKKYQRRRQRKRAAAKLALLILPFLMWA